MENRICIDTDSTGVTLYEKTAQSLKAHYKQLKDIKSWKDQCLQLKTMLPQSNELSNFNDLTVILDFAALVNIAMLDLASIARQLIITKDDWEKIFYSKHGYVVIYETIEQYNLLNQRLRSIVVDRLPEVLPDTIVIANELKDFKKNHEYDTTIKKIRNKIGAHINSFDEYYDTLQIIDVYKASKAIETFIYILVKILNVASKIANSLSNEIEEKSKNIMSNVSSLMKLFNL